MSPDRLRLWGFRRPAQIVSSSLGPLEREVMEVVWSQGEASVRAVLDAFGERVAYTTLMTTLDRLYKKDLLHRRKAGRAFLYSASRSREELERSVAADVLDGLLDAGAPRPLLSTLVDAVSDKDRKLLDELERLVRDKQKQLRGRRSE